VATLVLTVVGGAFGGPIGAALGSLAGQVIDQSVFGGGGRREGPRLTDLRVQTSSYGRAIPALFGTMRIAGTVIWATDLKEQNQTSGGGKSGPSVTRYNYSVSLAVALSSRPVRSVGRIWAEGNLLRGAAGDFKTPVGAFRLHQGHSGQPVDPLIGAALGVNQAPAFRGLAYVVLEDLQLADFGNRVPSLTFEIEADEGPVVVSAMASALAGRTVAYDGDETEPVVAGFAAEGRTALAALEPWLELHQLQLVPEPGGRPTLKASRGTNAQLTRAGEIVRADENAAQRMRLTREPVESLPTRLSLRFFDIGRDYQAGVQSADWPGAGQRSLQIELPAVMTADAARAHVVRALRHRQAGRQRLEMSSGWTALQRQIGDVIAVEGQAGDWQVETVEWADMVPRLTLRSIAHLAIVDPSSADGGSAINAPDLTQGITHLMAEDLPALEDTLATAPKLWALASGHDNAWRWAALFRVNPLNNAAEPLGTINRSVIGQLAGALAAAPPWRVDRASEAIVDLHDADVTLLPIDDESLLRGRNLCLMGQELVQFGRTEQIGPRRFRLTRLLRGRRGTEWAIGSQQVGDRFALLDAAAPYVVGVSAGELGTILHLTASGSGDPSPVSVNTLVTGQAMMPLAPVHGCSRADSSGRRLIGWTRRSRIGWAWLDGSDAPLGEESERYRIEIRAATGALLRTAETMQPYWTYLASDFLADAVGAPLKAQICQVGTFGASRPLIIAID
jgi:hypothetical protein